MQPDLVIDCFLVAFKLCIRITAVLSVLSYPEMLYISHFSILFYGEIGSILFIGVSEQIGIRFFIYIFNPVHIQEVCNPDFLC